MAKIPKQRTGSGGWPDRARVPKPKKDDGGCLLAIVPVFSTLLALLIWALM